MWVLRTPPEQSKRQKLSKKYNIQKKVREHRRKMRKEAKAKGGPVRRKMRRDPGIPNSCPFKADIISNLLRRKQEREEQLLREREEKLQQRRQQQQQEEQIAATAAPLQANGSPDAKAMQDIADKAEAAMLAFEASAATGPSDSDLALQSIASSLSLSSSSKQQHVAALQRQQQQQLRQLLAASDIIIHVLDARLPLAFRCAGLERWAIREGKKVILLLNKVDLLPAAALAAWLHQLRRSSVCPVLAFKCNSSSSSTGGKRTGRWCAADPLRASDKLKRSSSHALGVQPLLRLLSSIAHAAAKPSRSGDAEAAPTAAATRTTETMAVEGTNASTTTTSHPSSRSTSGSSTSKAFMTVGVVGYPNVGKSSVVNALTRSASSAGVAALPGSTRQLKYIKLDSHTQLIDSPGVLFAPPAREEDTARILPHPHSLIGTQQQQDQQQGKQQEKPLVASASVLLQSLLPVPQIPEPEAVAEALIAISSVSALQRLYQLPSFSTPREALQALAKRRGKLLKGGAPDMQAAAKMFLQEWQEGRVPYYSLPSGFKDEAVRLLSASGVVNEATVALQQELVDRQLVSLGLSAAEAAAAAESPQEDGAPQVGSASASVQGAMRLMFRDIAVTKKRREQDRAHEEGSERMEHVVLRQKQRKVRRFLKVFVAGTLPRVFVSQRLALQLEKKRRRGDSSSVSMELEKKRRRGDSSSVSMEEDTVAEEQGQMSEGL
ncbi:GTPase domain containing protein, putative [Eimeria mitis]|uniref:GTPase domain containing protein, putative n=1 Tax=Eimeria mitis TaxID=44415 RepID=U6KFE8_9EIME|nr:GTPase domain containing protein, putative [Eimeria mitis]CDJ34957.1 GTPase domain containing protein, putative [Eimeria mitis]